MSDLPRIAKLSALIGRIYDTCMDEAQWDPFLVDLSRAFGSDQALRVTIDNKPVDDRSLSYHGIDMGTIAQWAESKDHVDVWYQALMHVPNDTAYRGLDLCSGKTLHKSAFYSDSLITLDIEHTLGSVWRENADRKRAVAIYRSRRSGRFNDKQVAVYDALTSHFSRATRLGLLLERQRNKQLALAAALELSPFGIAFFGSNRRLIWSNKKADQIFKACDGITVRYGQLTFWDYNSQKSFDRYLRDSILTANHRGLDGGGALAAARPTGASAYHLLVAPQNRGGTLPSITDSAACLVLIHDSTRVNALSREVIQKHHGLSKAEARLAAELYKTGSLSEALKSLKIRRNTAKTQLSSIFAKVGVSNQAQLLQRLASGFAAQ